MKKIIKITESQLTNILKNVIDEGWVPGMDWYDPEYNDAFDDITDEKIIEAFEEYGLCADKEKCRYGKIDYHPQGDVIVYFESYELDGDFSDNLYDKLEKIRDKIGAEKMIVFYDEGDQVPMVKFLFYSQTKSIS